jgi:hypothetical protein
VNQTHTPPTTVTTAKNQNVPEGLIPAVAFGNNMLGTARVLPYWFAKWKHMIIEVDTYCSNTERK